jgi:hypothetical protein
MDYSIPHPAGGATMMITEDDLDQMVKHGFEIEKGKPCATCGHSFIPISKEDKFCKSCLWKLYLEIITDMENMFPLLCDSWRLDKGYDKVKIHRRISGVKRS